MTLEDAQTAQVDAWENAGFTYDMVDRVSLVFEGDHVVGWYTADMFDSDSSVVNQVSHPLYPDEIVAADTPAFKLVHLLRDRPRSGLVLFVVAEDSIIGTVSPAIFRSPLFRLCLFSLTLELEDVAWRAALTNPLASWNVLSVGRRAKAEEVRKRLSPNSRPGPSDSPPLGPLLSATMFADKGAIVAKRGLLQNQQASEVESLFSLAERVRNWSAHTRESDSMSPLGDDASGVTAFVDRAVQTIAALEALIQKEQAG